MPICPHCGNNHPSKALFCPKTGQPIISSTETGISSLSIPPCDSPTISTLVIPQPDATQQGKGLNPHYLLIVGGILMMGLSLIAISFAILNDNLPLVDKTKIAASVQPDIQIDLALALQVVTSTPIIAPTPPAKTHSAELAITTLTPVPTLLATPTPSPVPTQSPYLTQVNPKDQAVLVFVPAGQFIMGSDPDVDPYLWGAETPQHKVILKEYWIYQMEVTNAMYQQCVAEKACPLPNQKKNGLVTDYYSNPEYETYPVIYVNWVSAQSYCQWSGGRLPTEAEWEKAARGDLDARIFPWGNTPATGSQANFCDTSCAATQADHEKNDGYPNTAPIGSYSEGISPYGAMDMAGNVWEWVFDWFQPGYSSADAENPVGPARGSKRTIRGGSWFNPPEDVRIVQRASLPPDQSRDTLGFRCVVEVQP